MHAVCRFMRMRISDLFLLLLKLVTALPSFLPSVRVRPWPAGRKGESENGPFDANCTLDATLR